LVFWPRAGAVGAEAVLVLWAQLSWCELYGMKNTKQLILERFREHGELRLGQQKTKPGISGFAHSGLKSTLTWGRKQPRKRRRILNISDTHGHHLKRYYSHNDGFPRRETNNRSVTHRAQNGVNPILTLNP